MKDQEISSLNTKDSAWFHFTGSLSETGKLHQWRWCEAWPTLVMNAVRDNPPMLLAFSVHCVEIFMIRQEQQQSICRGKWFLKDVGETYCFYFTYKNANVYWQASHWKKSTWNIAVVEEKLVNNYSGIQYVHKYIDVFSIKKKILYVKNTVINKSVLFIAHVCFI